MFVRHVSKGSLNNWFSAIYFHLLRQMAKFMLMFFVILPRDSLQFCRFKHSFISQLVYTPDESIEIDSQIIDYLVVDVHSISVAKRADTLVSGLHSIAKVFFSDFLQTIKTIQFMFSNIQNHRICCQGFIRLLQSFFKLKQMSEVLYHDKQVTVYRDLIVINKYFFPLATSKTIMFSEIESIALLSSEGVDHRWGVSTKYLNNWFPLDTERKKKTKFIEFKIKGKNTKPSITPDDADKVFKIIWETHTPEGKKFAQHQKEKMQKETEVAQQELMDQQESDINLNKNPKATLKIQSIEQ